MPNAPCTVPVTPGGSAEKNMLISAPASPMLVDSAQRYPPDRDNQFPAVMGSVVVHARKNPFQERGFALGVRAGNGKDLLLPYSEAGYRPVARLQFQFHRVEFSRTAERNADSFFGAGNLEERAVLRQGTGEVGTVSNKGDEPPFSQFLPVSVSGQAMPPTLRQAGRPVPSAPSVPTASARSSSCRLTR